MYFNAFIAIYAPKPTSYQILYITLTKLLLNSQILSFYGALLGEPRRANKNGFVCNSENIPPSSRNFPPLLRTSIISGRQLKNLIRKLGKCERFPYKGEHILRYCFYTKATLLQCKFQG